MKFSRSISKFGGFALAALLALADRAAACAVCMGSDNPQTVEASNTVLWALLGLVGFIFVATGLTVLFLWRKSRHPIVETNLQDLFPSRS